MEPGWGSHREREINPGHILRIPHDDARHHAILIAIGAGQNGVFTWGQEVNRVGAGDRVRGGRRDGVCSLDGEQARQGRGRSHGAGNGSGDIDDSRVDDGLEDGRLRPARGSLEDEAPRDVKVGQEDAFPPGRCSMPPRLTFSPDSDPLGTLRVAVLLPLVKVTGAFRVTCAESTINRSWSYVPTGISAEPRDAVTPPWKAKQVVARLVGADDVDAAVLPDDRDSRHPDHRAFDLLARGIAKPDSEGGRVGPGASVIAIAARSQHGGRRQENSRQLIEPH